MFNICNICNRWIEQLYVLHMYCIEILCVLCTVVTFLCVICNYSYLYCHGVCPLSRSNKRTLLLNSNLRVLVFEYLKNPDILHMYWLRNPEVECRYTCKEHVRVLLVKKPRSRSQVHLQRTCTSTSS